jgi:hypothetical protein
MGGADAHEHRVTDTSGPSALQPGDDRLADLDGKREALGALALPAHGQLTGSPSDV